MAGEQRRTQRIRFKSQLSCCTTLSNSHSPVQSQLIPSSAKSNTHPLLHTGRAGIKENNLYKSTKNRQKGAHSLISPTNTYWVQNDNKKLANYYSIGRQGNIRLRSCVQGTYSLKRLIRTEQLILS